MKMLRVALLGSLVAFSGQLASAQTNQGSSPISIAKGGTNASTASAARSSLGLAIGINVQAWGANLDAINGLVTAADKVTYWTGSGTAATADLTTFSRSALAQSSAANWRTTLGVAIGSNVQAWDADLDCIAAISVTGIIKRTGAGTCSAGAVAINDLATGTQDTVLGYFGSTTASAAALSNCAGALTYSTSTHTFGCNASAGTGTVTSIGLTNSYGVAISGSPVTTSGNISAGVSLSYFANAIGSDISMNNTANFFDGPGVAQGTTGVWFASGTVTLNDAGASASNFYCKLWDGTTVVSSANVAHVATANLRVAISLQGIISAPAANIRISCRNIDSASAVMEFNRTGAGKDSNISAFRIQ
jgi:hypothetical protein